MHALENHLAARAADGDAAAVLLRRRVDEAEDALGGGEAALDVGIELGEVLDRREQHHHRGHEGGEFADRCTRRERVLHGDVHDYRHGGGGEHVRDRRGERGGDLLAHEEAAQSLGGLEETLCLVRVAPINLDHLVALDGFL